MGSVGMPLDAASRSRSASRLTVALLPLPGAAGASAAGLAAVFFAEGSLAVDVFFFAVVMSKLRDVRLPPSQLNTDVAQLSIELQRMDPSLPSDAGLLGAAERGAQVAQEPAIDPADAHVQLRRHPVRARQIGRPYGGRQPVAGVVRHAHDLLLAVKRRNVAARPEDLFTD